MLGKNIDKPKTTRMGKYDKCERRSKKIVYPYCERCCGNCACFMDEDAFGKGFCYFNDGEMNCEGFCDDWVADEIN